MWGRSEGEVAFVPMRVDISNGTGYFCSKQLPDMRFGVLLGTTTHFQMPAD
jgi:hypothetical protein